MPEVVDSIEGILIETPHSVLIDRGFKFELRETDGAVEAESFLEAPSGKYSLQSRGPDKMTVTEIEAKLDSSSDESADRLAKNFFKVFKGFDYSGADPIALADWLENSVGDESSIVIGSAGFQLAVDENSRTLRMTHPNGISKSEGTSEERPAEYKIVKKWQIPNGGGGCLVVIAPELASEAGLGRLASRLRSDFGKDRNAFAQIFTSEEAAEDRDRLDSLGR